ncbi:MAG: putative DNA modification/repair radical SAM protein, partial [Phycisphaerae bacterium]
MEIRRKLSILADAAKYDASCASSGSQRARKEGQLGDTNKIGICHSYTPDGRCVSLLKILLTNYCVYDCRFCVNRVSSDTPRARFTPEEVAWLTVEFYKRNYIEGLFLSSGIIQSADYTMEQLARSAELLRSTHNFNGYIHLKAVPGCSPELMERAGAWADRLSANIELPTQADLTQLAPEKTVKTIEGSMDDIATRWLASREERRKSRLAPAFAPAGQSTQMVVGATPSSDATILTTASRLYDKFKLRRVYYSAYSPIPHIDPKLPTAGPPLVREHRLYQSDWLMRFYGFAAGEIVTPDQPNLDLAVDPKLGWALRNRAFFPIDLNQADRWRMLRVPGLGVRTIDRLLRMRRWARIRLDDLSKLRVSVKKVRPFVLTADHNPDALRIDRPDLRARVVDQQLNLFETATTARS